MNELQYFFYNLETYPDIIKVSFFSILLTVFSTICLFTYLYFYRKKDRKSDKLREKHQDFITQYILNLLEGPSTISPKKILKDFSKKMKINNPVRDLVIELLILKLNEYDQRNPENIKNLISALEINTRIEKKLDFSSGISKLKTIEQISSLKLEHIDSKILPFAYSKNKFIRNIARYTYVQLSQNNPYKFFDEKIETFNKWDEISLFKSLNANKDKNLPNFSTWISYSKNDLLIAFLIKMVAFFDQQEDKNAVIKQLGNRNPIIREAAILTLGYLNALECEPEIIELYNGQPMNCQVAIIKTISKFNSGKGLHFLEKAYYQAINTDIQKIIAHEIFNYGTEGKELFHKLKSQEEDFNQLILLHVENPLIHYKYA